VIQAIATARCAGPGKVRKTKDGSRVFGFRCCSNDGDSAEWLDVTVWGRSIDFLETRIRKGSKVTVSGRLTRNEWTDQSGKERVGLRLNANWVELHDPKE